ncbi:MAG: HAD-IIB family hydrolase [Holosporaceae bacterium]|nr:HAD-IIB family hydrolase [Holosporaceae bacterium]
MINNYKNGDKCARPWGYWRVEEVGEGFVVKTIAVNPGAQLSLQSHEHRSEKWEIMEGFAEATLEESVIALKKGETVEIPRGAPHSLKNSGTDVLLVKEIQRGKILDENDIVRYRDSYGRCSENCKARDGGKTVFAADMDGTLTPARLPMTKEFVEFFSNFLKGKIFYIVSGSDYKKILEQVPEKILSRISGIFSSLGNEFYVNGELVYQNNFEPEEIMLERLENYRRNSAYPFELFPNYIEIRVGMINFSVLGRDCPQSERDRYFLWDKQNGERKKIADDLSRDCPAYDISIGGNISIDVVPKGFGKEQVANRLRKIYPNEKIIFLGDRIKTGGNDYAIAQRLLALGNAEIFAVDGPDDAMRILGSMS